MRLPSIALALLLALACGKTDPVYEISKNPVSVRGWVVDVKGAERAEAAEVEIARRSQLFEATSLWIEESKYASGGIAGNGAFVILDVPPGKATIGFNAPGAETAQLVLEQIPTGADVFIPDIILEPGGATVGDSSKILVRVAGPGVDQPRRTGQTAVVAGHRVPVVEVPVRQMTDRRDFPNPGGFRPVATVK